MIEKAGNQYDGFNHIPIPETAIEQTLDTIFIDTAYAIKPIDKYRFEDGDAVWYDQATGRLYADGDATLVAPDSSELDGVDEMPEIFFAKVWHIDDDGKTGQYYIADLRSMSGSIPRHEVTEMPEDQEDFSGWEEYHRSKRLVSAALISTADDQVVEKVGDPRLFEHLDRLARQVDEAKETYDAKLDEDEESAEDPDPRNTNRRSKLGQKVRSLLGRQ